jgi:outer membrane immunogenic protein
MIFARLNKGRFAMKRAAFALAVMMAGIGTAQSADLAAPMYKAPPMAAPVFSWTGCYIGISGGAVGATSSFSTWGAGGLVGGQLGCNYQMQHFVVGVEGEGAWLDLNAETQTAFGGGAPTITNTKSKWDADVAARFGLAFDNFLVYTKVGAIWINDSYSTTAPFAVPVTGSATLPGALLGVGSEYAITNQWIARAELNLAFMNSQPVTFTGGTLASENQIAVIGKLGISYKFF